MLLVACCRLAVLLVACCLLAVLLLGLLWLGALQLRHLAEAFFRLELELATASSSSCLRCLSWRRRIRRNLGVLRGSIELDELGLEEVLLEWALSNLLKLDFELPASLFFAAKLCL